MSGSIRVHPKYGLNPTLAVCWWCGKDTGEVVLLGAAYKGEAPHRMVVHREPCPTCTENMKLGITLIEAADSNGKPEPTGRWCVIREEAAERVFKEPMLTNVLRARKAFVTPDAWQQLGIPSED